MLFVDYEYSFAITQALNMVLDITAETYTTVDYYVGRSLKGKGAKLSTFRDNLNMAAFIIDDALIDIVIGFLSGASTAETAAILLDSFGRTTIKGQKFQNQALAQNEFFLTVSSAVMEGVMVSGCAVTVAKDAAAIAADISALSS
ncbi:MAG: hypothetical protein LBC72_03590 [Spirochaetaceae bacterium]|jgi:hypothetical protein|nr:hypothetical protein [Spirochaetaceae bacterium]